MLQELITKKPITTQSAKGEIPYFDAFVSQGLKLPKNRTQTQLFEISPELAEHILLKYHGHNRRLTPNHVETLRKAIRAGEWRITSQGISINSDGCLDDGQHRMHAIIAAQRTVTINVTVNADPSAFTIMDTGRKRTTGDVLSIEGYGNSLHLASAVKALLAIAREDFSEGWRVSNDEVLEFIDANELILETMRTGERVKGHVKVPASGLAVAFFLIRRDTKHPAKFAEFIDRLCDGAGLHANSPILLLQNYLMQKAYGSNSGRRAKIFMVGSIIKAWNAFVMERNRSRIGHADPTKLPRVK